MGEFAFQTYGKVSLCHQEQDPYRGAAAGRKAGRAETGRGVRLQPGTIREALRQLEQEGMVEYSRNVAARCAG